MYPDRDLDLSCALPPNTAELTEDLGLDIVCTAMAKNDKFIFKVAKTVLVLGLRDLGTIAYRQAALTDCLEHPAVVKEIYALAGEAVEAERRVWGLYADKPQLVLGRAVRVVSLMLSYLRRLRRAAEQYAQEFRSPGFSRMFTMLLDELSEEYLRNIESHLDRLGFKGGMLISAGLGEGNTLTSPVLLKPKPSRWRQRVAVSGRTAMSFEISTRDEGGLQVLEHLQSRAINSVANSLAQSAEHVRGFFQLLESELAFYVGCINLRDRLMELGAPMCLPDGLPETELALSASGLYDIGLCLRSGQAVVGNDLQADGKALVVITGANQGGKSTFLRSLGLAQVMMQAGMFVPAFRLRASLCGGVFTHFKREEDATMTRGKFDDELKRMSDIAEMVTSRGLLLCNEPFASTNEREGSEIAREVLKAFTDAQVRVVLVTHMFELSHSLYMEGGAGTLFLRAERLADGTRTFRLVEAAPLATSYGEDSYWRIFSQMGPQGGRAAHATPAVTGPR